MADKNNCELKNLFFFGISCENYDSTDVTLDIITNIRRRFLITKKSATNKLYRSAQGESYVYSYNFSLDRPLQWRVSKNKKVVEEIEQLTAGKYCINLYKDNGINLKKTFFDSNHKWLKTNYYSEVYNDTIICSLVSKEFDEGTSLLRYNTGEIYPERLLACSIPSCETVRERLLSKIPTPMVTALTNLGIVYFMHEDDRDNYEHVLKSEEANYKAETAPKVYVTAEDTASGFNLSVKDFDISKNLNRTFDISLAADFDSDDNVLTPSNVINDDIKEVVIESIDDGSVDAAISGVVNQINALTSLDIKVDDIVGNNLGASVISENSISEFIGDNIISDSVDDKINEQLKHIESVLDGSSIINSDHKLVIGDSVVDDDYISSIIDGIISTAFKADSEEVVSEISADVNMVDETPAEITELTSEADAVTAPVALMKEVNDNEQAELSFDLMGDEQCTKVASAREYIIENPADIVIESRGEVYSYYGSVDEHGKRSGRGRTLMSDGSIAYEGEYADDKRKGLGSFYFKDGTLCYWGNWDNNVRSGFGVGISSDDRAVHIGDWVDNKPSGFGARFDSEGNLMFLSSNCNDKKKGFTISDFSDTSFTVRVWSESDDAFIQREISINDIIK